MNHTYHDTVRLMLVTTVLLALLAPHLSSAQPVPTQFTRISVPGAVVTSAVSINDKSQVVGYYIPRTSGYTGFLYDGGVFTVLDPPTTSPGHETFAVGINNRGQVVGNYLESNPIWGGNGLARRAFLYDRGSYTAFQIPGSVGQYPAGINNRGQVIMTYYDPDSNYHSALYDHGVVTPLSPPDDVGVDTEVFGINDQGQVVGFYFDMDFGLHGFVYDHGRYTHIDFPGAVFTLPYAINNRGQIVGYYYDAAFNSHAFLCDRGILTTLDVPGSLTSTATSINDRGQIVGSYGDNVLSSRGYLYDAGVYTLFDAPGVGPGIYHSTRAWAINARGQTVGDAYDGVQVFGYLLDR